MQERENVPVEACIDTTYACNLRCVHCSVSCMREDGRPELTTQELRDLFGQLELAGTEKVTLTGGELLLRPDWLDVARAAKERFELTIFTNATSVTREAAAALKRLAPSSIEVSVYGATAATYESVTGVSGSHGAFVKGLRNLRKKRLPIRTKAILLRENIAEWPQMRRRYGRKDRMAHTLKVSLRFDGGRESAAHRASTPQVVAYLRECGVPTTPRWRDGAPEHLCGLARSGCVISAYGDVFPCGMLPLSGGNLREAPFAEIWSGDAFEEIRERTAGFPERCTTCDALPYCRPCWGLNYLETGDVQSPSPESCRLARLGQSVARAGADSEAGTS